MMWIMMCFIIFIFSNKSYYFISTTFFFETLNYSLLFLSPFMLFLCYETMFHTMKTSVKWKSVLLIFFLILFMSISFLSNSMMNFLIFLEISIMPIVYLVLIFSKMEDKIYAAWLMFFFNILGSSPFMMLISIGSKFNLKVMSSLSVEIYMESCMILMLLFLPLLCFKIPIFLSHFWLTKAHVSSAGFCSMILASLSLKLGSFGLLKFVHFFKSSSMKLLEATLAWSSLGFLIFAILMLRYTDIKYYAAVSSLLHMSFIFPACLLAKSTGCFSSLLMMVSHGLISPFFFFLVTILYEKLSSRSLDLSKSVESVSKLMSFILICCLLLNLGIPPFMMFFSELEMLKFMFSFSFLCTSILLSGMMVSIMHFMFFCTKSIYGKKSFFSPEEDSLSVTMSFFFLMNSLILLLFSY